MRQSVESGSYTISISPVRRLGISNLSIASPFLGAFLHLFTFFHVFCRRFGERLFKKRAIPFRRLWAHLFKKYAHLLSSFLGAFFYETRTRLTVIFGRVFSRIGYVFCHPFWPVFSTNANVFYRSLWVRLFKKRAHVLPPFMGSSFQETLAFFCRSVVGPYLKETTTFSAAFISTVLSGKAHVCAAGFWTVLLRNAHFFATFFRKSFEETILSRSAHIFFRSYLDHPFQTSASFLPPFFGPSFQETRVFFSKIWARPCKIAELGTTQLFGCILSRYSQEHVPIDSDWQERNRAEGKSYNLSL